MMTATSVLAIGEIVSLAITWGTQTRLRCPSCQHFTTGEPNVICRCGAVYMQMQGSSKYVVEALP